MGEKLVIHGKRLWWWLEASRQKNLTLKKETEIAFSVSFSIVLRVYERIESKESEHSTIIMLFTADLHTTLTLSMNQ